MKKITINVLALALIAGTISCDSLWEKENVPEAVKIRFSELYPNITTMDWDEEDEGYEAEFELSGRERSVLFDTKGKLLRVTEEIGTQGLPAKAMAYVQQKYGNYTLDEVHRVNEVNQIKYVVELESKGDDVSLSFAEDGKLLEGDAAAVQVQEASLVGFIPKGEPAFAKPLATWQLPVELREISGIALLPDNKMACIQDEEGVIFIYNLGSKNIEDRIKFAGPGDYEEIAVAGTTAYVLRSDGAVFEVSDFNSKKPTVTEHKSVLAATQDTEGLAYDEKNKRLLIACKGHDDKLGANKGVYVLDLTSKQMQLEPLIKIPLAQKELQHTTGKKKTCMTYYNPLL
ncbi:hypothetical protein GCM10028895_10620 [Pontibacter rugosus]